MKLFTKTTETVVKPMIVPIYEVHVYLKVNGQIFKEIGTVIPIDEVEIDDEIENQLNCEYFVLHDFESNMDERIKCSHIFCVQVHEPVEERSMLYIYETTKKYINFGIFKIKYKETTKQTFDLVEEEFEPVQEENNEKE